MDHCYDAEKVLHEIAGSNCEQIESGYLLEPLLELLKANNGSGTGGMLCTHATEHDGAAT